MATTCKLRDEINLFRKEACEHKMGFGEKRDDVYDIHIFSKLYAMSQLSRIGADNNDLKPIKGKMEKKS